MDRHTTAEQVGWGEGMAHRAVDGSQVKGWGVDADPRNEPTYPMRQRNGREHDGYSWERPTQQVPTVELLQSNERPSLSSVFGTSTPPTALSGVLRRFAFKYSESSYAHWLPLMLADRVSMVEAIFADLARGHVPNIFAEMGWGADWKHNRPYFVARLTALLAVVGAVVALGASRKK